MAPEAALLSASIDFTGSPIFIGDVGNIEASLDAGLDHGAEAHNASLGSNVGYNGYSCTYEGDYTASSILLDAIVRGSLGAPFISVWANGNERGAGCGSLYNTTAPPAPSKNLINVGALNSNNDSMTDFSSWGPTDDGRLKPDVSGPGCQSDDDYGVTSTMPGSGYGSMCGTSMASPAVTGVVALLLEDWKALYPGEGLPAPALVKALLMHTSEDLGNAGPDFQYGYGQVQAKALIDHLRTASFGSGALDQGGTLDFFVYAPAGSAALKVTMAWDDPPAAGNTTPNLVNDLDLTLLAPDGATVHYPWTLDPANPSAPAVRTQRDSRNNHEQVVVDSPAAGGWTVRVTGHAVAHGPQAFSITATPLLVSCSSATTLAEYISSAAACAVVQPLGKGSVFVMGWDFREYTSEQGLLFANAVRKAGRPGCSMRYEVLLGTSPGALQPVCTDLAVPRCTVELDANTTYYWTVIATNCCGVSPQYVSSFTTGDTGWRRRSADLLQAYPQLRGQTVRLVWRQEIAEAFTGPAQFDLDAVCLSFASAEGEGEGEVPADAEALVYIQSCGGGANAAAEALDALGMLGRSTITASTAEFLSRLQTDAPDLVVVDDYANALTAPAMDALAGYHGAGGRVILGSVRLNDEIAAHPLVAAAGVAIGAAYAAPQPVYPWSGAPLWRSPFRVPALEFGGDLCAEDGFELALTDGVAIGGYAGRFDPARTAAALAPGGRLIVHGFMPQVFAAQDGNVNNVTDMAELYANEIAMLLAPAATPGAAACPANAMYSQPPVSPAGAGALMLSNDAGQAVFEHYEGVGQAIGSVTWWGAFADSATLGDAIACTPDAPLFQIEFYGGDATAIGPLVASRVAAPRMAPAGGYCLGRFPVQRFRASLTGAVLLDTGWIAIRQVSGGACHFGWLPAAAGDGMSRAGADAAGAVPQTTDPAYCLGITEVHHLDRNGDMKIGLSELLRCVQFFNSHGHGCDPDPGSEDGYEPGGTDHTCAPHDADYNPIDWKIALTELLRVIQFYNTSGYYACDEGEDGFCVGAS